MVSILKRLSKEKGMKHTTAIQESDFDMILNAKFVTSKQPVLSALDTKKKRSSLTLYSPSVSPRVSPNSSSSSIVSPTNSTNHFVTPLVTKRRSALDMLEETRQIIEESDVMFTNSPVTASPVFSATLTTETVDCRLPRVEKVEVSLHCDTDEDAKSMSDVLNASFLSHDEDPFSSLRTSFSATIIPQEEANYEQAILFTDVYTGILACQTLEQKLFYACRLPNNMGFATLKRLLEDNKLIDVNTVRDYESCGAGLMHVAAASNNTECLQILMVYDGDVNILDTIEGTPLHYAATHGCNDAVHFLASNGANVNAKDAYDTFPLLLALKANHLEVVNTLLLYNADVHLKSKRGNTCLHIVAKEGFLKRVTFLIDKCYASIHRLNNDGENSFHSGVAYPAIIQIMCDRLDFKGLMKAMSTLNSFGQTIFHIAAEKCYLETLLLCIQALGQKKDEAKQVEEFLEQRLNEYDNNGYSPIHLATLNGHLPIIKVLAGCSQVNVNLKDKRSGNTALHLALLATNMDISLLLIELGGADLSAKNNSNETCDQLRKRAGIELPKAGSLRKRVSRTLTSLLQKKR